MGGIEGVVGETNGLVVGKDGLVRDTEGRVVHSDFHMGGDLPPPIGGGPMGGDWRVIRDKSGR